MLEIQTNVFQFYMKNLVDSAEKILLFVSIIAVLFIIWDQSSKWLEFANKLLKSQAVQACLEVGKEEYSSPENNSKSLVPNKESYDFCMKEKGL